MSLELVIVLVLILAAELVNGWTDAPNAIATVVGTGSLPPRQAIVMASVLNTVGVLSGTAVAETIGHGIVDPTAITLTTVGSAMVGIVLWATVAARWGIPTSESHALVAGLAGAGLATAGPSVLVWSGWEKVLLGLLFSSVFGFVAAFAIVVAVAWVSRRFGRRRTRKPFRWLQIVSSAFVAFGHGSNDGQKFMGIFTLALILGGVAAGNGVHFVIPLWVMLLCASVMAIGTSMGGFKIVRTLGVRLTKLETYQGFAAEVAAGSTITFASALGVPLSTTHTIGTAIMGAGIINGPRAVDWRIAGQLLVAWISTFPICAAIAWMTATAARSLPGTVKLIAAGVAIAYVLSTLIRSRKRRTKRWPPLDDALVQRRGSATSFDPAAASHSHRSPTMI
jgi:inorganic phosphate transporter, PiT family